MKIIRFVDAINPQVVKFGIVEGVNVYELVGDVLAGNFVRGCLVGALNDLRLLAPCMSTKIVAVALNFPGIQGFSDSMSEPVVLVKPPSSLCGHNDIVVNPFPSLPWWGEAELGVVIKKQLKNASESEVADAILGFTIANDTSVQNVEGRDHHLARSKCADNFCSVGPWIDTDFNPAGCVIEAIQNGEVIRRGIESDQFWRWPKIISWLSTWMTLEPWDLILTGNPPDTVGMRYLSDGDIYTACIPGLGKLTNTFILKKDVL